ncbi:MAG: hypothetical protein PHG35_01880 [Dehalococcoidales bacterium]|nr:hypothetical protein [Dehalococcoidales bacterium]
MGEIKTAAEIAREKLEKIGEPTEEERLKWKYGPEGEKLAALYLRENINLENEIGKFDAKARQIIVDGINDILLRNITLPRNETAQKINAKSIDGLKALKKDKAALENIFTKMQQILNHYVQEGAKQKKEAYAALKAEYEDKIQEAIRKQTGVNARMNIDVEKQPQFQEDWQQLQAQMEAQYTRALDEYKKELAAIK